MKEALIDQQWNDIVLPPAPEPNYVYIWLLAAVIAITSIVYFHYRYNRPKARLKRYLSRRIKQGFLSEQCRRSVIELDKQLNRYLVADDIDRRTHSNTWQPIMAELVMLEYKKQTPEPGQTQQLFEKTLRQLRLGTS